MLIIYVNGVSGNTVDSFLQANIFSLAIGMRKDRNPTVFMWTQGGRKYLDGLPGKIPEKERYVFRYGWRGRVPEQLIPFPAYGEVEGASIASNKYRFRRWAMEHKHPVPYTWKFGEEHPMEFPYLLRPMRHKGGSGYHIIRDEDAHEVMVRANWKGYGSDLIEKAAEYRIYLWQGRVIAVAEKQPYARVDEWMPWNYSLGNAVFKLLQNRQWRRKYCVPAIKAVEELGILFAGVDVIIDKNGLPYIVEVNSAPAIVGHLKISHMADLIEDYVNHHIRTGEWKKLPPYKKGAVRHPLLRGR